MAEPVLEVEKDRKVVEGQRIKDLIKLNTELSGMSVFLWVSLAWFLS